MGGRPGSSVGSEAMPKGGHGVRGIGENKMPAHRIRRQHTTAMKRPIEFTGRQLKRTDNTDRTRDVGRRPRSNSRRRGNPI